MRNGRNERVCLLARLVAFNSVWVIAAIGIGWLVSASRGVMTPHGLLPDAGDHGRLLADASYILGTNLRVAGTLLLGACTLGLLTVGHLAWLGYSLGYRLSAIARASEGTIPLVLSYLPCEFLAFVLTASVAQGAAWMTVRCLATRERMRPAPWAALLALAILLLAVAALLEAWVKPAIGALGRAGRP
jgi:uncharacterized membrane protein SpoIIM required for sporulation